MSDNAELRMVRGHIEQGEQRIVAQRNLIARLRQLGASTELAEQLLAQFRRVQELHEEHLARLERLSPHSFD
jgi:hypothetical protein